MQSCCIAYWLVGELRQHLADWTVFTVRNHKKNLQENYKTECNSKKIGGQIVECSIGPICVAGNWRRRTNEVKQLYGELDIVTEIKKRKTEIAGTCGEDE
jgi:hypothetical protein